jgi:hypothetical protein
LSQIIGYLTSSSGYICVDSNIVYADEKSTLNNKLYSGHRLLIASAGLAFGIDIIEGFLEKSKKFGIETVEDMENYFLSIANNQYRQFIFNYGKKLKETLIRLYFIFIAFDKQGKLSMGLVGAEGDEPLKRFEIKNIVCAPRRLSIEMALTHISNYEEGYLVNFFKKSMEKISLVDKGVKPPFQLGIIQDNGSIKKFVL